MKERIIQVADWAVDSLGKPLFHDCQEIIRYRDCKHVSHDEGKLGAYREFYVEPDDFCS